MTNTLVLGGARSGKSGYAEMLAAQSGREVVYIATGRAGDSEMAQRIEQHRRNRPRHWLTVEEPIQLADAIERYAQPGRVVLVDCLTLWLSNLLFAHGCDYPEVGIIELPQQFGVQRGALLDVLRHPAGPVILVTNEVGMGVTPLGAMSRCFADEAGRLNQAVAALCDRVVLMAAGLPLLIKGCA